MTNAVIYARYSSHNQTEQSIEGQLADAYAFAERNGYTVIGEYIDRALTGTKDARPDFQRMIKDAEKKQFQVVIVWKLDRFARNRYDSAIYKAKLKKFGIRVISVMENITDSPEGIILEGLLEAMAEYYSANLAENVRRGIQESLKKGHFAGGAIPLGYRVEDRRLVADDRTAPLVRELYRRYADGEQLKAIAKDWNQRGYRTARGRLYTINTFCNTIPNPTYIGEYTYDGQPIPGLADPLVDRETYDRAVARRAANRRAPAARRSPVTYLLQGKLFCGPCGMPMTGECGRSRSGDYHYYYKCSGRKHKTNDCRAKAERKDFLEQYVCEQAVEYILAPERVEAIAQAVEELYARDVDDTRARELSRAIDALDRELNTLVDRLATVPDSAVARISERLGLLENQRADLEADLAKLRLQQRIRITKKEVAAWLHTFAGGDLQDADFRRRIIDSFINSVYLYEDKIVIYFNVRASSPEAQKIPGQPFGFAGEEWATPTQSRTLPRFVFISGIPGVVIPR